MTALLAWEISTIRAIASEELERERMRTAIIDRDRWLERAEAIRQEKARTDVAFRRELHHHAQRLGIPSPPAPRSAPSLAPDGHVVASREYAARWLAIRLLVERLPAKHPWRDVHRELVTYPLLDANQTRDPWELSDMDCYALLHQLEAARDELVYGVVELPDEPTAYRALVEAPTQSPAARRSAGDLAPIAAARAGLAETLARARRGAQP